MKKFTHALVVCFFIFLILINSIFLIEIKKDSGLNDFFYKGVELSEDYSEKEKLHMEEVKELVLFSIYLSLILSLILWYLGINKEVIRLSGYLGLAIGSIFILFTIFFKSFFYYFHIFSFDSTNWLLPQDSKLIQEYPMEHFRNMFFLITSIFLFVNIILINNKKIKSLWDQLLLK